MSERSEWPSTEKLAQLREQGHASSSPISTRSASCAAALAALMLTLTREGHNFNDLADKMFSQPAPQILELLLSATMQILVVPAIAALVAAVACTLFQTRFLYAPVRLIPRLIRNMAYHSPIAAFSWNVLVYFATLLSIALSCLVIGWSVGYDLLNSFNQPLNDATLRLTQIWRTALDATILITLILGVIAAFVANLLFRRRHRMTRAELLSQRES